MVLQSTRWLALGYFTYFFSYGIFLPFLERLLKGIGLTPETIGLLLGAGLVARFLGSLLIAPRVSDPSRLISALRVLALLTLLFAVAFWAGAHVAWLMLVMIGFNLFFSPLVPLTDALANTWQKQFPLDYGKVRLWGSVAFVIGSALTGKLVTMFDYRVILALLTLGRGIHAARLSHPSDDSATRGKPPAGEHRLVSVVGAGSPELALSGLRLFIAGGTCGLLRF
ncbi:putative 3-phenylpropionate permease [Escherichia coli]|uniref:Putative 3-phenylpropionate permease n=1 Tax=Escherichia coli TaxID=562 RepID=A0A377AGZ4_ECOLX|nr:putative 3-phenylpropionate permease [Escherichia coli]